MLAGIDIRSEWLARTLERWTSSRWIECAWMEGKRAGRGMGAVIYLRARLAMALARERARPAVLETHKQGSGAHSRLGQASSQGQCEQQGRFQVFDSQRLTQRDINGGLVIRCQARRPPTHAPLRRMLSAPSVARPPLCDKTSPAAQRGRQLATSERPVPRVHSRLIAPLRNLSKRYVKTSAPSTRGNTALRQ